MICTVAPSSDASAGAAERCSGRIVLPGDDEKNLLGANIEFEARPGPGRNPGSLTLTFHPSRLLTGVDAHPALIARSGKPLSFPSSAPGVTNRLLAFPFKVLAAINDANSSAKLFEGTFEASRIRIRSMKWEAFLPCSDPNALLEVLAVAFGLLVNDKEVVLQSAQHLGLRVKYDADPRTNKMKSVSLEKRQGQRKLFTVRFSADSATENAVRLTMIAHADGLASIVAAARRLLDDDEPRKASCDFDAAGPNTASQLDIAFWALGRTRSADKIVRRSLGDWLIPYLLRKILRLDVIGKFSRKDLRGLSALNDDVAREWVAMSVEPGRNYAEAMAEATGLSDQTVYNRRHEWLKQYGIAIEIPYSFYADLLSLGSLSAAQSNQRAALLATEAGADPEVTMRALRSAFAAFDRRRSIIGKIAYAIPREVEVVTIDPTIEVKPLREGQGRLARADKDRVAGSRKRSDLSRASGNRGAWRAVASSVKAKGATRDSHDKAGIRRNRNPRARSRR
jgi:hypothetical protein